MGTFFETQCIYQIVQYFVRSKTGVMSGHIWGILFQLMVMSMVMLSVDGISCVTRSITFCVILASVSLSSNKNCCLHIATASTQSSLGSE